MCALEQEHLRVILLDRRNRVLETVEVYKGSVNSSQVRVGELFKDAIRTNASAIIVVHNHPSGTAQPSRADEALTQTLKAALALVDVRVLDHMIVAGPDILSMAEKGLM